MAVLSEPLGRRAPRAFLASSKEIWVHSAVLLVVLGSAAVLRFASIGAKSFWFDEAYSATLASHSLREIVALAASGEPHPPLYYLLLSLWGRALGPGDAALRALGAVASIVTVAGTYWVGRRLGGPLIGAVAAFLTAVAPFQIRAAQEARMYPLLGLLTLLSWGALLAAVEGRRWGWVAYVAATVASLYTHYFAFLTLIGQGIFILAAYPRLRQTWVVSQLAIVALYLPWLGAFFETFLSGRAWPFFRPPVGVETLTTLLGFLSFGGHGFGFEGWFGGNPATPLAQTAILVPFLGLAAVGVGALRRYPPHLWFVLGYLVIPVAVAFAFSLRHNIFYPRYFSFVFPAFAILCAFGIIRIADAVTPGFQRVTALTLGLIVLSFNAPVLHDIYTNPKYNEFNWRAVATLVSQHAGPRDLIVVIPAFGTIPFTRYFHGRQQVVPMTPNEFGDITAGRAPKDPAAEARSRALFRSYAAEHEVMWIVATTPLPTTALERLGALLEGIYDLRAVADFNGVKVYQTTRHAAWERRHAG